MIKRRNEMFITIKLDRNELTALRRLVHSTHYASELAKIIRRGMQTKPTNPVDIDFSAIHQRLEDKELDRLLKELER